MAQSSNYKTYNRQPRTLTEETSFSGGMMWTGNNIDETHLKTIVNFNYDDTTGFLKTRNPIKPLYSGEEQLRFKEITLNPYTDQVVSVTEQIEGLYNKQLIGVYNMCYIDTTDPDVGDVLSKAGWLYLFGSVVNTGTHYTCLEQSLVWLYLDADGMWHNAYAGFSPEFYVGAYTDVKQNFGLVGTTGIKPILYDNTLYCTSTGRYAAFNAYRICKVKVKETDTQQHIVAEYDRFEVCKQPYVTVPVNTSVSPDAPELMFKSIYEYSTPELTPSFDSDANSLIDSVTLLEATVTGFNGLRGENMYTYQSTEGNGTKRIEGAYFTDKMGAVCISPRIGQDVTLHVVLDNIPTENKGVVVLQRLAEGTVAEANAVWEDIGTPIAATTNTYFNHIINEENPTYNIVWKSSDAENATRYDGMLFNCSTNKLNSQLKLKSYNVPSAKGSCLWNTHLVLWDIEGAPNTLFISETENFYYMPVPNNVSVFESDIIVCIPYMGDLLVFTADRVYRLVEGNDGTFAQEVVQNNMPIAREDAAYIRAIKNMVFFKAGSYYYMIVPKSQSLTGELTVAPIYKNLAGWFTDPNTTTREILMQLYPENQYVAPVGSVDMDAVSVSNPIDVYVEQDTVTLLYHVEAYAMSTQPADKSIHGHALQTKWTTQCFTLFVNYNTNLRAWTMYLEDTTHTKIYPAALTAARTMSFVCVDEANHMWLGAMQDTADVSDGMRCLIDTGYRTLSNTLKKRFREVQLKLYDNTESITAFGSAFFVDGNVRRNYKRLEQTLVADSNYVSLAPVYDPNTFLVESSMSITDLGDTVLSDELINKQIQGSDSIELSDWTLDFSHFKRGAPATVRIPVSGKGYSPRFIFMSPKCVSLHLNEINWVYRTMNGR